MGKIRNLFKKIRDTQGNISCKDGHNKDRNSMDLTEALRKGTPLASRVAQGVSGPSSSCMWNLQNFPKDARVFRVPPCCAFILRDAFQDVYGHRVLINS